MICWKYSFSFARLTFFHSLQFSVKVVIDQFLQAPALLAFMIMGMALMEGRGIDGVRVDMENQYVQALIKNCKHSTSAALCCIGGHCF